MISRKSQVSGGTSPAELFHKVPHVFLFVTTEHTVILFEEAVQDGEQFITCTDKHTAHAWSRAVVPVNIEMIIFGFGAFVTFTVGYYLSHLRFAIKSLCTCTVNVPQ